ncbi:MAG: phosphoenolpyruvate carboxykinase domain-containing protein, partial [Candidatus Acidiferrales bacterium]
GRMPTRPRPGSVSTTSRSAPAAATGKVGVTRRDPMAMLPFCGYNMGDYFQHWLDIGKRIPHPPRVFHVNWFRKGADGKFLWPGFGENVRVLKWILERTEGKAAAQETPIGFVPTPNSLTLDGLKVSRQAINELLEVNASDWAAEQEGIGAFLAKFGDHLPPELREEQARLARRLGAVNAFSR